MVPMFDSPTNSLVSLIEARRMAWPVAANADKFEEILSK
jgi:hypothetical protein